MFIIKKGDTGQEVRRLQGKLGVVVDGSFGEKTELALRKFQSQKGLTMDGVCGWNSQVALGMEIYSGIDVSSHNGTIDWKKVGKTDTKFAFIKLTEGRTHKNPNRVENWSGAKANGLVVGGYHFAKPTTDAGQSDAEAEAEEFVKELKNVGWARGVDFAPALDLEDGVATNDQYNVDWCIKFCEYVHNKLNVVPIVYTGKWFWDSYLAKADKASLEKMCKYPVWWARYPSSISDGPNLAGWSEWNIWQWTGSGTVDGINGHVDRNFLSGGKPGLNKLYGV